LLTFSLLSFFALAVAVAAVAGGAGVLRARLVSCAAAGAGDRFFGVTCCNKKIKKSVRL